MASYPLLPRCSIRALYSVAREKEPGAMTIMGLAIVSFLPVVCRGLDVGVLDAGRLMEEAGVEVALGAVGGLMCGCRRSCPRSIEPFDIKGLAMLPSALSSADRVVYIYSPAKHILHPAPAPSPASSFPTRVSKALAVRPPRRLGGSVRNQQLSRRQNLASSRFRSVHDIVHSAQMVGPQSDTGTYMERHCGRTVRMARVVRGGGSLPNWAFAEAAGWTARAILYERHERQVGRTTEWSLGW